MKKNDANQDRTDTLRQCAEAKLDDKKFECTQDIWSSEANALLHELRVHQIELEMQNEELRYANARTENALSKYYELYDLAPIGYFTINVQGRILEVNQAGASLLEVENRFLLNNYFQNYIADDCLSLFGAFKAKITESETKQTCEIKLLKKGKAQFHALITGIYVKNHYKSESQLWFSVLDMTDRIKAEEAKEEARKIHEEENKLLMEQMLKFDKLKTEYFSNISHELRTPLNVILSSLKLLELKKSALQAGTGFKLDKHLSTIKQNSYRLLRLINNIIDITKIESGFFEIHLSNCNIVSIVEDVTLSVVEYIENRGVVLVFDTDVEEKVMACDPDKVERIMLNLLSNAVKFTKPGGNISVNVCDRGQNVEIVVNDTGIGIPGDKQDLIFQRFRQVDTSLAKEHEGSGIGLSLVKSLIDLHEGSLSLESEYGKGSKFVVRLPVKILDIEENTPSNADKGTKQTQIERLNIEFSDIYS